MNVSSPETSYCLFQGLNVGEMWEDSYSTIDELCSEFKTHSDASVTRYYTRGSPLYLVLYWYMGYTSINATVLVNVTKCKAVFLNICKYYHYCINEPFHKLSDYMYNVTHHTKLRFMDCDNYQNRQTFCLPPRECVVLVFFDKFDLFQRLSSYELLKICKFTLSSTWGKNKIHYIDAFLGDGNYLEGVGHMDCFSSKHPVEYWID